MKNRANQRAQTGWNDTWKLKGKIVKKQYHVNGFSGFSCENFSILQSWHNN